MNFWNSIEKLDTMNGISQGFAAVLGIIAAVLVLFSFVLSQRQNSLQKELTKAEQRKVENLHVATKEIGGKVDTVTRQVTETHNKVSKIDNLTDDIQKRTKDIQKLQARVLTEKQKAAIEAAFTKLPKKSVMIIYSGSKEGNNYSAQFQSIFTKIGWENDGFWGSREREPTPFRIACSEGGDVKAAEMLAEAVKKITGQSVQVTEFSGSVDSDIIFDVGILHANEYQSKMDTR